LNQPAKTPRQLGYRMPAEWEPHEATWLAWPNNPEDWPGKFPCIPWLYAEIVRLLAARERVHLIVEDAAMERRVRSMLTRAGVNLDQVNFHRWPTDRGWTRDSGPIFVRNTKSQVALTNWRFNAWAKYDDWHLDDKLPGRIEKLLGLPAWQPVVQNQNGAKHQNRNVRIDPRLDDETSVPHPFPRSLRKWVGSQGPTQSGRPNQHRVVLEGGSIDTNGQGLLLTTEECLLSEVQQRNPGLSRAQLERVFHDYLGIDQVIWLGRGIVGDDTHGHIDDIARFAAPDTIVAAVEPDPADPNHAPLAENLARLNSARTPAGKQFTVVELPMPRPVVFRGQRLPASYANFYIANGVVLVPTFHDPRDRIALNTLAQAFPDREIIGVHSVDLIWGLGALHCMTQQQPAGVQASFRVE
jgi:agmatine deiminase